MRHGKKINHLSRKSAHRKALLANMASSLILHKRISTTVAKAKELRKYVEPLLTKSKNDTTHSRRIVFSYLGQKEAVKELFDQISNKVAERPGGYTRIIKTGNRLGDNAETCIIELVDYNEIYVKEDKRKAGRKRTRRAGSTKKEEIKTEKPALVSEKAETKEEVVTENESIDVQDSKIETEANTTINDEVQDETPNTEDTTDSTEPEQTDNIEDNKKE